MIAHFKAMSITLTDSAAAQIKKLCDEHRETAVRLSVNGGGCNGFSYEWGFAKATADDDTIIERNGAKLAIDAVSFPYLADAEIDYVADLSGSAFKIKNPIAVSSCGCGTSFAV